MVDDFAFHLLRRTRSSDYGRAGKVLFGETHERFGNWFSTAFVRRKSTIDHELIHSTSFSAIQISVATNQTSRAAILCENFELARIERRSSF